MIIYFVLPVPYPELEKLQILLKDHFYYLLHAILTETLPFTS